ncbi:MAG: hypothetical protein AAGN82_02670 [Myxococcota bacterium]
MNRRPVTTWFALATSLAGCHVLSGVDDFRSEPEDPGVPAGGAGGAGSGGGATGGTGGTGATGATGGTGGKGVDDIVLPACAVGPSDDFTGMNLDEARWERWYAPDAQTSEVAGRVDDAFIVEVIQPIGTYNGTGIFSRFSPQNDAEAGDLAACAFTVRVEPAHAVPGSSVVMSTDHGVGPDGVRRLNLILEGGALRAEIERGDEQRQFLASVPYNPEDHRWWGIMGQAGGTEAELVFAVSANGREWSAVARVPFPFTTKVRTVAVGAGATGEATAGATIFDDINLPP